MRRALFGCTADPFTLAHREIVKQVLERELADSVIVAPTIVDWHRPGKMPWLTDWRVKVDVIRKLLAGIEGAHVFIDDLAMREKCAGDEFLTERFVRGHRFVDVMMEVKTRFDPLGMDELWPVFGSDSWLASGTWFRFDKVLQLADGVIIVDGRGGRKLTEAELKSPVPLSLLQIEDRFNGSSATDFRLKYSKRSPREYVRDMLEELRSRGEACGEDR